MHKLFDTSRFLLALILAASICVPVNSAQAQDDDEPQLTIGSEAPDLEIEHWVSDNDGMFPHVTKIEEGRVYVVEFWATWCGPCISSMPHIAKLQKKYEQQDVQFISVSDEDLDTVDDFLEKEVRGDKEEKTYADLTNTYCLTTDPDESVKEDYFRAAGQTGIPCAFIVGKTGLIEWIGHPMRLDKPLKQVVNDEWDREAALVARKEKQVAEKKAMKLRQKIVKSMRAVQSMVQSGEEEEALELIDELIMDDDMASAKGALQSMRLQIVITSGMDGAAKELTEFVEDNKKDPNALNEIAWGIYERHQSQGDVGDDVMKVARQAAEYAAEAAPESGAILDTLAHLIYVVDEDLDKAIEVQKKAVEHAGVQLDEIKPFLKQLQKEKRTGEKPKKEKSESDF